MNQILLINCRLTTSENLVDILIKDCRIAKLGAGLAIPAKAKVIDCGGGYALPAFVDIHTHLREPGFEGKETILSASQAAVAGGYSSICSMPNTKPVADNEYIIRYITDRAREANLCRIFPIGAITKGQEGKELAEMLKMKGAGACAVSDDGLPVMSGGLMRLALEYAAGADLPLISHAEDMTITAGGVMHEGALSAKLGLKGINRAAEDVATARDIAIADATGTRIHIAHVSTRGAAQLIREAKARGVAVTAETCPHYICGTDELCDNFNALAKVNPPLRTEEDKKAIIAALKDGTIDCIATDHAPHANWDKDCGFDYAAFGISGLETAFALCYTHLVKPGHITLKKLSHLMSYAPAKIIGLPVGEVKRGGLADITVVITDKPYLIDPSTFASKGKNTPFGGMQVYGKITLTIVNGEIKHVSN
jgi:dihydroorotase